LCAFPQIAIYDGVGNPNIASSWSCGVNQSHTTALCSIVKMLYKSENGPITDTLELGVDPRACQSKR
jgi:hypothetical protein